MPHESRSFDIQETLFPHTVGLRRTLRVTEHEQPEFVRLRLFGACGTLESDITVDIGVLRGFLTWLRDGD